MQSPRAPRLLAVAADREGATSAARALGGCAVERLLPGVEPRVTWCAPSPVATRILALLPRAATAEIAGRLVASRVDRERADLVLSTDRVSTLGIEWLRRRRGLALPTATCGPDPDTRAVEAALRRLASAVGSPGPRGLPAPDALFAHVDSPVAPQHVGTVLVFEPGPAPKPEHAAAMLAAVPGVLGHLRPASALRAARWLPGPPRPALSLVDTAHASGPGPGSAAGTATPEAATEALTAEVDRFFSIPLHPARELGRARVVTGLPDGCSAVLVKLHHALGDGLTVMQALLSETDGGGALSWATRPVTPVGGHAWAAARVGPRRLLRGLWLLATAGRAPVAPTDGPLRTPVRRHALVRLPGRQVRTCARTAGVSVAEWLTAAFAQALYETGVRPRGRGGARFRVMVPWSVRGTDSMRVAGNHTGAVSVDLPVDALDPAERVRRVARALRHRTEGGAAEAANLMVYLLGALPPRLHAAAARSVYRRGWFNAIGTVLPGPRRTVRWHGRVMSQAYPVLALAPDTGLAWGAMTWGEVITICLTAPEDAGPSPAALTTVFRTAALTPATP